MRNFQSRNFSEIWKRKTAGIGAIIIYIYIYIIYAPNCASSITIFVRERERGRFNRARDGASGRPGRARESLEGATAEHEGATAEHEGAPGERRGSAIPDAKRRSQFGL